MNLAQIDPPLTPPGRGTGQPESLPSLEGLGVGSWSQCTTVRPRRLSLNRNSQVRMTNHEIRKNPEIRMTKGRSHRWIAFEVRASDSFRDLSFVIRHSTGSRSRSSR